MISVLYVDDEPDLCELGKLFLERSGDFTVDTTTAARTALASEKIETYDAIVSDYQMPEMDGIEFLRAVRENARDIPFILFTGRGREEIVIAAINGGADFYLQKGGDPTAQFAELAHKIRIAVERRQAKNALKDSEHRFADIINFLPDATFAIDRAGHVIAWNRAIEEMTGVPATEILGKSDHEYGLPFYGEKRPLLIDLVFSDAEEIRKKYPIVRKNEDKFISEIYIPRLYGGKGAYLWFIASPLYDAQGTVVGAIESIRDITDRKHAEGALSESEQRLNDIINFLPDATLAVDRSGRVIAWNRAIEEMTGVPAAEMLGKNDHEYAIPFYGARRRIFLDLIFTPDDPVIEEYSQFSKEKDTISAETSLA
ncbi:MAG: PAS domain S-box protein, partial [Methanomicrobiales archaeon]|nr:PAS domain S-box protein [Methanomicrobiales archaeon]